MKFPSGTTDHPITKSGKRKIFVSVWDFGDVHPQSERSHYVWNDHPAKMRPSLARAILKLYGESPVLDPMAGIGTTLVEASLLGMNAVGVEYEKRFVNQANENIKCLRKLFPKKKLGKAVCVQGDARRLSLALRKKKAKSILFSPPYWKAMKCGASSKGEAMEKYLSSVRHARKVGGRPISKALAISSMGYSTSKENRNVTKFGSIVLSPPYFDALSVNKGAIRQLVDREWNEGSKSNAAQAYKGSCDAVGIHISKHINFNKWSRRQQKIPWIPLEREIDALIAGCSKKMATFLQLLKETWCRAGEAWRLEWTDVDLEQNVISINDPEKKGCHASLK